MGLLGSIGSIAGSVFGGAGGGAIGGALGGILDGNQSTNGGAGTQSTSKDPWGPAQPYIKDNLSINQGLQDYYAQNPFTALQQQSYQKLFDTLSNNQAGGNAMLANSNAFMNSRGGKLGPMQAMPTGTQAAPIDWKGQNPFKAQPLVDLMAKLRGTGTPTPVDTSQADIAQMLTQWRQQQAALAAPQSQGD